MVNLAELFVSSSLAGTSAAPDGALPPDVLAEIERDVGRYRQTRLNSALKKQSLMEQKVKRLETTNHNLKKEVDALRVRFKLERKYFYGSDAD